MAFGRGRPKKEYKKIEFEKEREIEESEYEDEDELKQDIKNDNAPAERELPKIPKHYNIVMQHEDEEKVKALKKQLAELEKEIDEEKRKEAVKEMYAEKIPAGEKEEVRMNLTPSELLDILQGNLQRTSEALVYFRSIYKV